MKTHIKDGYSELYSLDDKHYFGSDGTLYMLTMGQLVAVLNEVKDLNPMESIKYLIEEAKKERFKVIYHKSN